MTKGVKPTRRIGRPVSRFEKLEAIPTHCPESLHRYLKTIYPYRFASLTALYEKMLTQFIDTKMWEHGVDWRKPRTSKVEIEGEAAKTGWVLVNVQVEPDLKQRVRELSVKQDVSMATIAYTAMYWWAMFVMPASSVAGPKPKKKE
ncbi:MAG TPA: hypothetical protein VF450_00325 [Noviherbaspirillum sp.]